MDTAIGSQREPRASSEGARAKRHATPRAKPAWIVRPFNPDTDQLQQGDRLLIVRPALLGPPVGWTSNRKQGKREYVDATDAMWKDIAATVSPAAADDASMWLYDHEPAVHRAYAAAREAVQRGHLTPAEATAHIARLGEAVARLPNGFAVVLQTTIERLRLVERAVESPPIPQPRRNGVR